jgi:WhiB family transcriptional regulator, redox-sensing transcriptional regulator
MPNNTTETDGSRGNSRYTYMELLSEWALADKYQDWKDDAACRGVEGDLFFPGENNHYNPKAFAICKTCPVRERCLMFAINNEIIYGIWGGMTPPERQRYKRSL